MECNKELATGNKGLRVLTRHDIIVEDPIVHFSNTK